MAIDIEQIEVDIGQVSQYYVDNKTLIARDTVDGITARTLSVPLAKNALVRRFDVTLTAARADATTLGNAAQVRLATEAGGKKFVVADFGALRTVSGVGILGSPKPSMQICAVYPWRGSDFDTKYIYFEDCDASDPDSAMIVPAEDNAFEVRTERLKVAVKTTADLTKIASSIFVKLPDLPSDIDVRIDNGPPVFTAPGAAQPGSRGWDANAKRVVPLADALNALAADPTNDSAVTFDVVLSSRVPGSLDITANTATQDVVFLTRIAVGPDGKKTLDFDSEGVQDIALPLPAWVNKVEAVRLTVTGAVPPERVLPPVGPPIATFTTGQGQPATQADLVLDVDHSAAALLPTSTGLAELTGVRLPLRAEPGSGGAEARVVLYTDGSSGPGTAIDGGASKPVVLDESDSTDDVWSTFAFAKPVKLKADAAYWAVVVLSRGKVSWSLGRVATPAEVVPLRRGLAPGPWHLIPTPFPNPDTVGARVRAVGHAPKDVPVAPLLVSVVGAAGEERQLPLTPTPKGVRGEWTPAGASETTHPRINPISAGGAKSVVLRLTSRVVGSFTVSDVDVVATKP